MVRNHQSTHIRLGPPGSISNKYAWILIACRNLVVSGRSLVLVRATIVHFDIANAVFWGFSQDEPAFPEVSPTEGDGI